MTPFLDSTRRVLRALGVGLLLVCVSGEAIAQTEPPPAPAPRDEAPAANEVPTRVTFILAAPRPAKVDERLAEMAKDLKRAFAGRFRRFDFLGRKEGPLTLGKAQKYELPGGGELKITFAGREGKYIRLQLETAEWSGGVRVREGRRFFHAGRKQGDGYLVVGIRPGSS